MSYNMGKYYLDTIDAVYIPPEVDTLTDEENIDDDLLIEEHPLNALEIAGTFEIHSNNTNCDFDDSDDETLNTKKLRLTKNTEINTPIPIWKKGETRYEKLALPNKSCQEEIQSSLGGKSPLEIFYLFFDDEVLSTIVNYSLKYANDNNRHSFEFGIVDLKRFIGILILSGYHKLPQSDMYWSKDEDKGLPLVRKCMSRNRFRDIKRNLHLSDNSLLDKKDKFSKLRPIFNIINKKNLQFGIFAYNLSIDEQMVPYFGRHSCKMFIKGKPVRFGFKIWCLTSADGYLFYFMPYGGADVSKEKSELGLGGEVVVDLLSVIQNPENHRVFFRQLFLFIQALGVSRSKGLLRNRHYKRQPYLQMPFGERKNHVEKGTR